MYLFPTKDEMDALWSEINPRQRVLGAMAAVINDACNLDDDSMAAFFLNNQDVNMLDEEGEIHIGPPRYLEHNRECPVNFKGWTFELPKYSVDLGEKVEWDDI